MFAKWQEISIFAVSEQRLADQVRAIMNNAFLSNVELEEIEREIVMEENNGLAEQSDEVNESGEEMHSNNLRDEGCNTDRADID